LTGYKLYAIGYYRRNYVKKRSNKNNWRTVEAVKDARTSSQPAGGSVQDWRQAGQDPWQRLRWLLCPEGEI
jgi:hypothetical protein